MKAFLKSDYRNGVIALLIGLIIIVAFVVPIRKSKEVLLKRDITGNYIFAADIEYNGKRIGASSELCCFILFNPEVEQIHVIVEEGIVFDRRYPDETKHPKKTPSK